LFPTENGSSPIGLSLSSPSDRRCSTGIGIESTLWVLTIEQVPMPSIVSEYHLGVTIRTLPGKRIENES
jgi:hypothetical protein